MIKVIIKTDSIKVKRARLTAGQRGVVARPDGTIKAEFGEGDECSTPAINTMIVTDTAEEMDAEKIKRNFKDRD